MRSQHNYYLLVLTLLFCSSHGQTISCPSTSTNSTLTAKFTPTDALGPFYLPNSPKTPIIAPRPQLIDPGNVFVVTGQVIGNNCVPLANAQIEAWYAGETVFYHAAQFRGQVFADDCGRFLFTQTFPAVYSDRPVPHIHYRVSTPDSATLLLVTQLYFQGLIPTGFAPDSTQIAQVEFQPDGSRTAHFNVYVNAPGTANVSICGPHVPIYHNHTTSSTDEELPVISSAMEVDDESLKVGASCGNVVCDPGLECCNESCGICVEPGTACRMVGCVGPVEVQLRGGGGGQQQKAPVFDLFD
jgi:protocatechuate 3,4-dioxygenase beta subunit